MNECKSQPPHSLPAASVDYLLALNAERDVDNVAADDHDIPYGHVNKYMSPLRLSPAVPATHPLPILPACCVLSMREIGRYMLC